MRRLLLLGVLWVTVTGSALAAPAMAPVQSIGEATTAEPTVQPLPSHTFAVMPVAVPQNVGLQLTIPHPGSAWRYVEHVPTVADAQAWALRLLGPRDYNCLYGIVWHESHWNPYASNHEGSGAYGLPQALPGSRMASAGADWQENPETQIRWLIWYTTTKYGGLCQAAAFRDAHGWY